MADPAAVPPAALAALADTGAVVELHPAARGTRFPAHPPAPAGTAPTPAAGPPAPAGPATTRWPTNARGQTYGSGLDAISPADEPDLMQAIATNGRVGYVLAADLAGPEPSGPQEALARQAAQAGRDQTVPVYASDGTTQVGVFVITH